MSTNLLQDRFGRFDFDWQTREDVPVALEYEDMFAGQQSSNGHPTLTVRRRLVRIVRSHLEEPRSVDRMSLFIERLQANLAGDLKFEVLDNRILGVDHDAWCLLERAKPRQRLL